MMIIIFLFMMIIIFFYNPWGIYLAMERGLG